MTMLALYVRVKVLNAASIGGSDVSEPDGTLGYVIGWSGCNLALMQAEAMIGC